MKSLETRPIDARRALILDVKAYIRDLHTHPERRIPRSFVYKHVGADDSTYSIWQSDGNDTIPHLFKLLQIASRTQTQAQLFEILGRHAGLDEAGGEASSSDLKIMAACADTSGRLTSELAKDLVDEETPGYISPSEAIRALPKAVEAHEAAERALNHLLAVVAKGNRHDD